MTYYEYDGGIAVVLGREKAFAWDDIDNAWKPVVASEIYGDERAIEVAEDTLAETLDAYEAKKFSEDLPGKFNLGKFKAIGTLLYLVIAFCCLLVAFYTLVLVLIASL